MTIILGSAKEHRKCFEEASKRVLDHCVSPRVLGMEGCTRDERSYHELLLHSDGQAVGARYKMNQRTPSDPELPFQLTLPEGALVSYINFVYRVAEPWEVKVSDVEYNYCSADLGPAGRLSIPNFYFAQAIK